MLINNTLNNGYQQTVNIGAYTVHMRRYVARVDKSHPLIALSSQSLTRS